MNDIERYQAAEFKSAMLRLGVAAMLGSEAASQALAEVSADVSIEHALTPARPGVAERYRATVEATAMACFAPARRPGRDADLPQVWSAHG
ncbi:hypothetical protein [Methylobacterium brachiatum]|jgi:hypothetical protein|uniref:hypothetical protein n=1 Tax=Methylobacterium brachiatum TaxID=269660 RepID=UPI0024485A7E|nr:hypothetical protein [Methylobacterium brachiatum]MDH2309246.1 hypothetical protein [Methylobacterium brachiatum]